MFEGNLVHTLLDDDALTDIIGDRLRPLDFIQGEERPCLAYSIVSKEDPSPSHEGASGFWRVTYEIEVISEGSGGYRDCAEMSEHVRRILDGYSGTNSDVDVVSTKFENETDIEQLPEAGEGSTQVFMRVVTFDALYSEGD